MLLEIKRVSKGRKRFFPSVVAFFSLENACDRPAFSLWAHAVVPVGAVTWAMRAWWHAT